MFDAAWKAAGATMLRLRRRPQSRTSARTPGPATSHHRNPDSCVAAATCHRAKVPMLAATIQRPATVVLAHTPSTHAAVYELLAQRRAREQPNHVDGLEVLAGDLPAEARDSGHDDGNGDRAIHEALRRVDGGPAETEIPQLPPSPGQ